MAGIFSMDCRAGGIFLDNVEGSDLGQEHVTLSPSTAGAGAMLRVVTVWWI